MLAEIGINVDKVSTALFKNMKATLDVNYAGCVFRNNEVYEVKIKLYGSKLDQFNEESIISKAILSYYIPPNRLSTFI